MGILMILILGLVAFVIALITASNAHNRKVKIEETSQNVMSDIEELKELSILKTQGMITEEEFAAMKAKIISR